MRSSGPTVNIAMHAVATIQVPALSITGCAVKNASIAL